MLYFKKRGVGNVYRIRFAPYLCNNDMEPKELNCMRVYSDDWDMIRMFLRQHNFDIKNSPIENISYEKAKSEDQKGQYQLKIRKFYSNEDNQIHDIVTSDHLLSLAVDYCTNELGSFSLFGPCIIRKEYQVIKIVSDILESLPYTQILDHLLMDDNSVGNPYDTSWMEVSKDMDGFMNATPNVWDTYDLSYIYELIDHGCNYDVMPMTLEAYVKAFVSAVLR